MSKSTISTFQLFEMFPDQETARTYLESRLTKLLRIGRNCVLYTHGTKQTARQSRRRLGL